MAVDSSKTEKATPKKREDERKKGHIFQSTDVVSSLSILAIFFCLKLTFPYIYRSLSNVFVKYIGYVQSENKISVSFASEVLRDVLLTLGLLAGPVMLTAMAVSILATGMQTKFKFSKELLKFKFSKLNPVNGIRQLFSLRSLTELIKAILKIALIGVVLYQAFMQVLNQLIKLMFTDILQAVILSCNIVMDMVIKLSVVFLGIAALDYFYQWWDYERNIRMSKQEIKEEYKQMEGDPQIKSRIREQQRKMSMQRMMQKVPDADVVIRNPTHIAVALKYTAEKNGAPVVVAKGQDYIALKIIEIAQEHHIPMKEDKPLAHALYKAVEIGHEIPPEFYSVIAEILAWVYSLKKETKGS